MLIHVLYQVPVPLGPSDPHAMRTEARARCAARNIQAHRGYYVAEDDVGCGGPVVLPPGGLAGGRRSAEQAEEKKDQSSKMTRPWQ